MPPLTATSKTLEPVVLAPNAHSSRDAWIAKVFGSRGRRKTLRQRKPEDSNDSDSDEEEEEHSYREELTMHIAESTANLSRDHEEPLQESDEDSSDDEPTSPCSDIFDFDEADSEDEYVAPPVEVPRSYRTQDLQGGMVVGGDCVLFTNWAFKRQLQRLRRLCPIPERRDLSGYKVLSSDEADAATGTYAGKIVEL